jgi:hypothetical protein
LISEKSQARSVSLSASATSKTDKNRTVGVVRG